MENAITYVPGGDPIELVAFYDAFTDYYPFCEMQTKRWFVETAQRDWTVFDVGANIGYYSILMSRLCPDGAIHAFEPTTTIELLKKNVAHHGVTNVIAHPVALGARSGRHRDGIFRIWGKDAEKMEYEFLTVDDAVARNQLQRLNCIKIDVDSFDFEVLRGAEATLRKFNPWVVVELNHALDKRGHSPNEALEWLTGLGYHEALVLDGENFVMRRAVPAARSSGFVIEFEQRPIFVEHTFLKNRLVANLFEGTAQSHNGAAARGQLDEPGGVLMELDAPRWSYGMTFDRANHDVDEKEPIVIEVELEVIAGSVGIGCVTGDYSEYLTQEIFVKAADGRQSATLVVEETDLIQALVFRNVDEFDTTTSARVTSIRAYVGGVVISDTTAPALRPGRDGIGQAELQRIANISPATEERAGIGIVSSDALGRHLGFSESMVTPFKLYHRPLASFKLEVDDAPILRFLFQNVRPERHLEFGTRQGFGTTLCASSCDAEIWTLNLPEGKGSDADRFVYTANSASPDLPFDVTRIRGQVASEAGEAIGGIYRKAGFADRIHQILADSREWDTSSFTAGFFDSIMIDGGHTAEVVKSDTEKALPLLRSGGMMLWHDFCPDPETIALLPACKGVVTGVAQNLADWAPKFTELFWIRPSFLLVGIKC